MESIVLTDEKQDWALPSKWRFAVERALYVL